MILTAVRASIYHPCVLIRGPPGTGKTFASMGELASMTEEDLYRGCIAEMRGEWITGLQVVVAAATNNAVDESLEAFLKSFKTLVEARKMHLNRKLSMDTPLLERVIARYAEQTRVPCVHRVGADVKKEHLCYHLSYVKSEKNPRKMDKKREISEFCPLVIFTTVGQLSIEPAERWNTTFYHLQGWADVVMGDEASLNTKEEDIRLLLLSKDGWAILTGDPK